MNTTIEITEQVYLIKLPKDRFEVKFISALIKGLQSEQIFLSNPDDEDLISRRLSYDQGTRFDHLSDK